MRNAFLKLFVFLLSAGALTAAPKPNIVILYADDLGYGDPACYGSTINQTPNLDRMAREGVRFTQFYSACGFCAPSRGSLLTGRYPFRHGVTTNPAPDGGINDVGLSDQEITIAAALKPAGYATGAIGKWHLGHKPEFFPTRRGFDEYYGILYSNDMRPVRIMENEGVAEYPVIQANLTGKYTAKAVDFIQRHKTSPFFLYLPHAMPHKPLAASEEFYRAIKSKGKRSAVDLYGDAVRELDWSIGVILQKLVDLKIDNNTLVLFSSDNGPFFGGSTGGLRGMKGTTFEGGIRVPMIAWMPGAIPAGRVADQIGSMVDFFPTALKLAGVSLPTDRTIDGRDLWPLLTGKSDQSPHEFVYAVSGNSRALRAGQWKLHVTNPGPGTMFKGETGDWVDPRAPDGITIIAPFEQARPSQHPGLMTGDAGKDMMLFDLAADPAEQHNAAKDHPEIVARLKAMYDALGEKPIATPPAQKKTKQ